MGTIDFSFAQGIYETIIDKKTGKPIMDPKTGKPLKAIVRV